MTGFGGVHFVTLYIILGEAFCQNAPSVQGEGISGQASWMNTARK